LQIYIFIQKIRPSFWANNSKDNQLPNKIDLMIYKLSFYFSRKIKKDRLLRGETFLSFADKILVFYDKLYDDPYSINDGDTVYCDTHEILKFVDILNLKKNLTIITHNSDFFVCDNFPENSMGISVDSFFCYKKWFAQNSYSKKNNVIPIPIGFENLKWERLFGFKTKWIEDISKLNFKPSELVYFNCNLATNLKERKECFDFSFKSKFVNIDSPNLSYTEYLKRVKQHKFILSPRGNGLDCHRTWEVLKLKRIPVLKREGQLEQLYSKMPVLFIDNWSDLNDMNLDTLYENYDFENQDYLTKDYWYKFCNVSFL